MATPAKAIIATGVRYGLPTNSMNYFPICNPFASTLQRRSMSKKKSSGSSYRYMERQVRDPFVKKAQAEQFRARSSFKLVELLDKHRLLLPQAPMCIVDCGAAPGGWSQVVARKINATHADNQMPRIVAIDILPMQAIPGVHFIRGDFLEAETKRQIAQALDNRKVGLLLSDMAPAFTGHHSVDADRTMNLCEDVIAFSKEFLAPGGSMVLKFFMGGKESELRKELRRMFRTVHIEKPEA
ncbi:2' O-ribose methyltransferase, partial [Coemansia erecta]